MKRLLTIILSILLCTITMSAQNFTDHLTSKAVGQGTVTVHQDSVLNDMVNGKKQFIHEKKEEKKDLPGIQKGKKTRARGYRIQVYWGGSTTADQTKAQRAGSRVTTLSQNYKHIHPSSLQTGDVGWATSSHIKKPAIISTN